MAETTISAYTGTDGASIVYEGVLDGKSPTLQIEFTTPYLYSGGNLLVGVYQVAKGTFNSAQFFGETVSGACVQGYDYSNIDVTPAGQYNFLPKTTFTYGSEESAEFESLTYFVNEGETLKPSVSPYKPKKNESFATNVTAGVALNWPIAADELSQTTVKVAGLPAGLKFTAKDIVDSKTKQMTVPANTIYGAPTSASAIDKKTGLPKPSDVKITVTTAGKSSVTYLMKLTVDPLPSEP